MPLPNFLIIGAAKSGTTAIYSYIKQHPDIYMSPKKELRYFSNVVPINKKIPKEYIHEGVSTLAEYMSFFNDRTNEQILGESSPMYLYTPGTAERIKQIIPDVKMLAILRNPVDRAFSAFTHALREWKEPAHDFGEALLLEPERIEAGWGMLWHYRNAGFYYEQLSRFYNVFKQDQIKVVLYDDLVSDSVLLMKDIFKFLGVDPRFTPDTSFHPNVSGFPKSKVYHNFVKRLFIDDNLLKRLGRLIFNKKTTKSVMVKIRNINLEKRQMDDFIRHDLQALFKEDILKLETLIHRDLSNWLL